MKSKNAVWGKKHFLKAEKKGFEGEKTGFFSRISLALLLTVFFASFLQARTISEISFSDIGQADFLLEQPNSTKCFEVPFTPPFDLNGEVFSVVSVRADFAPFASRKSAVKVSLNNETAGTIGAENFQAGWGRFNLPQEKILGENILRICATTSFETAKITVFNDSKTGYYFKPEFERSGSFELFVTPPQPDFLDEFSVKTVLKNFGSESAKVLLKYRRDQLEKETPETELVKGQIQVEKTVPACTLRGENSECLEAGVAEFEFVLRPKVVGPITLLPAIAEFENPFGEKVIIESSRPTITVIEPQIKIRPFLQVQKEQFLAGEKVLAKLVITNESQSTVSNFFYELQTGGLQLLRGQQKEIIEAIQPKETITKEFILSSIEPNNFVAGCTIEYVDFNAVKSECNKITIGFKNPAVDATIIGAGLLVVLSVAIYAYIHLKK